MGGASAFVQSDAQLCENARRDQNCEGFPDSGISLGMKKK